MIWNFFAEFSFTSQHFLKSSLLKNTSRKWLRKFHFRKNPFPAIKFGKKICSFVSSDNEVNEAMQDFCSYWIERKKNSSTFQVWCSDGSKLNFSGTQNKPIVYSNTGWTRLFFIFGKKFGIFEEKTEGTAKLW